MGVTRSTSRNGIRHWATANHSPAFGRWWREEQGDTEPLTPEQPAREGSAYVAERAARFAWPPGAEFGTRRDATLLLDLNLGSGVFELLLDGLGLGLGDSLLDLGRSAFDEILGFLEAQAGDLAAAAAPPAAATGAAAAAAETP
jgi:hypothetical protein